MVQSSSILSLVVVASQTCAFSLAYLREPSVASLGTRRVLLSAYTWLEVHGDFELGLSYKLDSP